MSLPPGQCPKLNPSAGCMTTTSQGRTLILRFGLLHDVLYCFYNITHNPPLRKPCGIIVWLRCLPLTCGSMYSVKYKDRVSIPTPFWVFCFYISNLVTCWKADSGQARQARPGEEDALLCRRRQIPGDGKACRLPGLTEGTHTCLALALPIPRSRSGPVQRRAAPASTTQRPFLWADGHGCIKHPLPRVIACSDG